MPNFGSDPCFDGHEWPVGFGGACEVCGYQEPLDTAVLVDYSKEPQVLDFVWGQRYSLLLLEYPDGRREWKVDLHR